MINNSRINNRFFSENNETAEKKVEQRNDDTLKFSILKENANIKSENIVNNSLSAVLPVTSTFKNTSIVKDFNDSETWINFLENQMNKRQVEVEEFLLLKKISLALFKPGDILLQKVYQKKARLDKISLSWRYLHKNHIEEQLSSPFSLHVMIVIDGSNAAHMNEPYCEMIPLAEEEIVACNQEDCNNPFLVYRFSDSKIAAMIASIASQKATVSINERQEFLTGYSSIEVKEKLNFPRDLVLTNAIACLIKNNLFSTEKKNSASISKSWCSKWVFEIIQESIVSLRGGYSSKLKVIMKRNADTISSKNLEGMLNKLCLLDEVQIVGRTAAYGKISPTLTSPP